MILASALPQHSVWRVIIVSPGPFGTLLSRGGQCQYGLLVVDVNLHSVTQCSGPEFRISYAVAFSCKNSLSQFCGVRIATATVGQRRAISFSFLSLRNNIVQTAGRAP